jgi:hypothetical protein
VRPDSGVQNHRQHLYTEADIGITMIGDELVATTTSANKWLA